MKYLLTILIVLYLLPKGVILNGSYSTTATITGKVSWYAKGLKNPEAFTTACWSEFPKGTKFLVSYRGNSVVVTCNDRGHFKQMGRVLDLSAGSFRKVAPLSRGIITARIEVIR